MKLRKAIQLSYTRYLARTQIDPIFAPKLTAIIASWWYRESRFSLGGGGVPSYVNNSDSRAMYDPAKLAGLNTDYVATPATQQCKGTLKE